MGKGKVEIHSEGIPLNALKTTQPISVLYQMSRNNIDKFKEINFSYVDQDIIFMSGLPLKSHRNILPATIYDSYISWYRRGSAHNINGPARIYEGMGIEYWLYGKAYTKSEWEIERLKYLVEVQRRNNE